jgi:hypothetical protein
MKRLLLFLFVMLLFVAAPALGSDIMEIKEDALTRGPSSSGPSGGLPVISGVVTGGGRAFVIIGGRRYSAGDEVTGYRVVEVGAGWVVLERAGRRTRLLVGG